MEYRNYHRYLRADWDRQREEAWLEMHRRPDAEPLPYEPERPWFERVIGVRWLVAGASRVRAARAARSAQPLVPASRPSQPPPRPGLRHP